jgi:hypothetical protein
VKKLQGKRDVEFLQDPWHGTKKNATSGQRKLRLTDNRALKHNRPAAGKKQNTGSLPGLFKETQM